MKTFQHLLLSLALAGSAIFGDAQSTYKCPEDNGKTIIRDTKKYELHCAEGVRGLGFQTIPATDPVECAEICASNPECKHVVHNGKKNECDLKKEGGLFPYTKYPFMTWYFVEEVTTTPVTGGSGNDDQQPIGGGGATENENSGSNDNSGSSNDSGSNDNLDNKASYSCPEDNLSTYTTGDFTYELHCGQGHSIGHWMTEQGSTLKACADRCAQVPECNSCDFNETTKTCALKKAPSQLTPWGAGHAWFPVTCPSVRATQANERPEVTTNLSCPRNDGKIYEGSDGTWFYLQCCTDTDAASVLDLVAASSHEECLQKCVDSNTCKSFTYAAPDGNNPNCKLYGHGKFSHTAQPGAHHAFVTNPPTEEAKISEAKLCSTECPEAHGQLFVSVTGKNFQMTCNKRHGTTYLKIDRQPSFEACMISCAAMPACHSAEYEPRTNKCYYSNNHNQPAIDAPAFVSAHSLGCAGACSSCKKGCEGLNSTALGADVVGCDADHGKIITAGGEDFRIQCRHCYRSWGGLGAPEAKSAGECAKACADNPNCHGANWMGPNGCYMHDATSQDGSATKFAADARCDALMPQSRSLADPEVKHDESPNTTRDW